MTTSLYPSGGGETMQLKKNEQCPNCKGHGVYGDKVCDTCADAPAVLYWNARRLVGVLRTAYARGRDDWYDETRADVLAEFPWLLNSIERMETGTDVDEEFRPYRPFTREVRGKMPVPEIPKGYGLTLRGARSRSRVYHTTRCHSTRVTRAQHYKPTRLEIIEMRGLRKCPNCQKREDLL